MKFARKTRFWGQYTNYNNRYTVPGIRPLLANFYIASHCDFLAVISLTVYWYISI